jgi:hypothetical protein
MKNEKNGRDTTLEKTAGRAGPTLRQSPLTLAALVLALNACGPQAEGPGTSETESSSREPSMTSVQPTKPFDTQALVAEESIGKFDYSIGSSLGSPVISSNTCGATNQYTPSCAYSSASDHSYLWTAPFTGSFTFTTAGAGYDTVLHIYDVSNGAGLGCNDDSNGTLQSSISLTANAGQQLRIVVDGYGGACGSFGLNISGTSTGPAKNAMTWSLLGSAMPDGSHAYALVGSDNITNAYTGDTSTTQALPVLCINKSGLSNPGTGVIGSPTQTPGGAWRRTWSGGTIALTSPVTGTSLTSRSVADSLCASQFGPGYRMAEFHDGDANYWCGWDFWGAAWGANLTPFMGTRFWVSINDQNANPW